MPLAAPPAKPDSMLGLDSPVWVDAPPLIARAFRRAFDSATSFTVGLEEELLLLDPVTFQPANVIEWAMGRLDGDDRFCCEFSAAQIELRTPPAHTAFGACPSLPLRARTPWSTWRARSGLPPSARTLPRWHPSRPRDESATTESLPSNLG